MKSILFFVCLIASITAVPSFAAENVKRSQPMVTGAISQTVVKMPIAKDISMDDAVDSMKLRANFLNMKLVAELPLSKQVEATTGKPERRMTIYQFCDALTAKNMVDYSMDFAAYLPCRIALIEDEKGHGWLVMMDLNILINSANLNPKLKEKAIEVRNNLESIMKAGANGEL
ncbi:DUF302 domain-containing protein [Sulfurirhabdus autotrophica]|uniref:Uncharacterized protein (DUF302 family) n=1 Tax=Sulfurirhabdus autotrophica TaxID=1706046 RepID=A0A4V6P3T2_9PROT|nr:DUF302 domain-containing protein [Sulfurirhabdus autotrophica]TCV82879.1 uncharacterized protein (DUF302 family) [Sulfurirhabdus autotrophica]